MAEFNHIINVIPFSRVALSSSQTFTYLVPVGLQGSLRIGHRVMVPFGKRNIEGVVSSVEMTKLANDTTGLKPVQELLDGSPVVSEQSLVLAKWLAEYYVTSLGVALKAMLPKFGVKPKEPAQKKFERSNPDFVLTEHQREAVNKILNSAGSAHSFLLHGVTGSGKTEVYMRVLERVLEKKQQAIMLVPEISLTPQAVERFGRRFGMERVAIVHSRMKASEKRFVWNAIREGEKDIIIGPRSAVFSPVANLGLIVIDEEHDGSYKQENPSPRYHAREAADRLSQIWSCPLVLGDATPSVATYFRHSEKSKILVLPYRIKADLGMPKVQIVDMRKEIQARNFSIFSENLKAQLLLNLKLGKQIILFLNRRGASTIVMCRDCGYVSVCPECSAPLVWHSARERLVCHHCGAGAAITERCPNCHSHRIKQFGVGTQRVEAELHKFLTENLKKSELPEITRMDKDSTIKGGAREAIYDRWVRGEVKILIGTKMIGKGWDVSNVGLVGIVSADTLLHLPDFRANERTFQVITQVAGRTGRGKDAGLVVLQTYNPENKALRAAKNHNYELFFSDEIKQRKAFHYPPFVKLVKLQVEHANRDRAKRLAGALCKEILNSRDFSAELLGPSPSFIPRLRGKYRFQIILKIPYNVRVDLYRFFQNFRTKFTIDVDPESLL